MRRPTILEGALVIALGGSILAVAAPTLAREVRFSRFAEPTEGLARIAALEAAYVEAHHGLSPSAPLTPQTPPRGTRALDSHGDWDHPAWQAIGFMRDENTPYSYSFSLDTTELVSYVATARGDLDGDGVLSRFEVRGDLTPTGVRERPGMYVEAEFE